MHNDQPASPQQSFLPPLQLKGEIMDLEFTIDTDHRKRRRNRTTQSCLNCHTSKRKCDRKRPCQRCIQLGLTGLCVYEIDDPALRDDPSVDENTRLRNRIAELESLVRELRGKPHPRWADSNFRDGDPNEKWHSRATKCAPLTKRRHSPDLSPGDAPRPPQLLPPIKTEVAAEASPHLYRFSASPGPPRSGGYAAAPFSEVHRSSSAGSFDGGGTYDYPLSGSDDGHYGGHYSPSSAGGSGSGGRGGGGSAYCSCRASPGMAHAYISLSQALQTTLGAARTYAVHPPGTPCVLYRRIADLASLMQYVVLRGTDPTDPAGPAYDSNTPTDSEVLTPLSASASTGSFHGGSPTHSGHSSSNHNGNSSSSNGNAPSPGPLRDHDGWGAYNPYFPIAPSEHIYGTHVIS
ncbi:hypothetical protein C8F04DRAFT_964022 [Mycena alexandri]|uniref:Zn(2)-C6 fungal-type domain-containing protein n=1 Tax=Mycena alexandri TaxID=1745969 RepID=A0AAD6WX52_9AGAR|nr:hypothetical protein C8F04DRAFT_975634 [Mycena alexandri]KAJ7028477.1 hypothetical protein C8F04DRAFT_964022 [Mycena alexandri]